MSQSSNRHTRRQFLAFAGATAAALPVHAWWPSQGARGESFRLAFFTDIHARTEWETPRAMGMAAAAINDVRADLVVAGGDLITDGFQSAATTVEPRWKTYLEMHGAIRGPVEPVIGNHDLVAAIPEDGSAPSPDPQARFRNAFGLDRTYRSFTAGGYHFLLLDSIEVTGGEEKYHGRVDPSQLTWISEQIAGIDQNTPIVMASHVPLLTTMYQATEGAITAAPPNRVVENNLEVLDLFARHNLLLVLQGHLHVKEMIQWQNTTFITGGAVCGKWWRGSWHGTPEGFGVVTLRPDRVDWEYRTYGWEALRP